MLMKSGTLLGLYEIAARSAPGGMGEVYKELVSSS
jgi:hypothetical protein